METQRSEIRNEPGESLNHQTTEPPKHRNTETPKHRNTETLSPDLHALTNLASRQLPRLLTQVCRDPGSPFYGCWDRNWWHYKIRDFPSMVLQQGGYAAHLAAHLPVGEALGAEALDRLAAASARFWNRRARRHGAFEEYYPFEQGYPPLAFPTLAVAKLAAEEVVPTAEIHDGLKIAARQLLDRFESRAANQQVTGAAAAAVIRRIAPELIEESRFGVLLDRTLELRDPEGWFPEYDGPDLGYLTVTMDSLWDLYDATGDDRCLDALDRALDFIAWFTDAAPHRAGMHNARNTDYFVPYALARLAAAPGSGQAKARRVFAKLFSQADQPDHFLAPVDDRYWCHYLGHSLYRALHVLRKADGFSSDPGTTAFQDLSASGFQETAREPPARLGAATAEKPDLATCRHLPRSGHARLHGTTAEALVSARKGAILTVCWPGGPEAADFGWLVRRGNREWVSHWWSNDWSIHIDPEQVRSAGPLVPHREHASSPLKHAVLRLGSFFLGRRLIGILKRLLIFKTSGAGMEFERTVRFEGDTLVLHDKIHNLRPDDVVVRAPRSSKRHVASADSHHFEDLDPLRAVRREETIDRTGGTFLAESRYRKSEPCG